MLYPAELLRQVTVAIIPVFRPDCKCPLQFCARFLILQDGHEPLHGLRLRGNRTFWKQQKKRTTKTDRQKIAFLPYCVCRGDHWSPVNLPQQRIFRDSFLQGKRAQASNARPYKSFSTAWKNPTARKQLDISIKRTLKIAHCLCLFCAIQQRKKAAAISLPQLFGGSWWIRTTEALSSRFTVCPHWPLGKAPIFCFVSAVSPGNVCYYSKGVSKLQAFFWNFLRFFQKSLFLSQHRAKTILDILLRLAYIYI